MGKTQILGSLVNTILTDSSNNVGLGGAANASFKLQVTGATNLTGALSGTSAVFSSTVQASAYRLTGMTAGSGALYWSSDRVTLANYNASGTVVIETGGGTNALTLAANQAATFSSSVRVNNANDIARLSVFGTSGNPSMTADTNNLFSITGSLGPQLNIGGYNGASYGMWFQVKDSGNSNVNYPILLQPLGGAVGIGTVSPAALLHLGVANAAVDGTKGVKITNPAGTTVMLECGVSSDSFVGTTSASDFSIRTGNAERIRISNGGLVTVTGTGAGNTSEGIYFKRTSNLAQGGYISGNGGALQIIATNEQNGLNGTTIFGRFNGTTVTESMTITSGGNVCINTTLVKSRLGTNTKFTVAGSGSNAAGNSGASMGAVAGTGSAAIDTGIDIEATDGGLTLLFLASRNTSGGTNTASAVYIISFYYSGTFPVVSYIGGTSNFVTFGQSGTSLTATNAIGYGNFNCSWFASK
jgi:hypothetical protein